MWELGITSKMMSWNKIWRVFQIDIEQTDNSHKLKDIFIRERKKVSLSETKMKVESEAVKVSL